MQESADGRASAEAEAMFEDLKAGENPYPPQLETHGVMLKDPPPPPEYFTFATAADMRSHIFQTDDIRSEDMVIPEWKVKVKVKGLTGTARALTMKASMGSDGTPDLKKLYAHMVVFGIFHPGTDLPVFKLADMTALMDEKSGGVIERVAMRVTAISGLDQASQQALEKN